MSSNKVIDLWSDTVTRPSREMLSAMCNAELGDDVRGDDPTVNRMQASIAAKMGKEAGVIMPSASMANLISVMAHCYERGMEMLVGDKTNMHIYEQGTAATIAGVHHRTLSNLPDGTFSLEEAAAKVRGFDPQGHLPKTKLVCMENTQCACGGKALPMQWLKELFAFCKSRCLALHCDGARIFNAATALGVDVKELVQGCDSVTICLSKGLGAPIGAVLVGSTEFVTRARHIRKAMGGGMRQAGILAAAAEFALEHNLPRLAEDHIKARVLAKAFSSHGGGIFRPDMDPVASTNIVMVYIDDKDKKITSEMFLARLKEVRESDETKVSVTGMPYSPASLRMVTHLDVSMEEVEAAAKKIETVLKEFVKK